MVIADGPSTDMGEIALGKNVTVAFIIISYNKLRRCCSLFYSEFKANCLHERSVAGGTLMQLFFVLRTP